MAQNIRKGKINKNMNKLLFPGMHLREVFQSCVHRDENNENNGNDYKKQEMKHFQQSIPYVGEQEDIPGEHRRINKKLRNKVRTCGFDKFPDRVFNDASFS
jgi:hypothetical protein